MKANVLLEKQHDEVRKLFTKIEKARGRQKVKLFEQLAATLVAHDAIEREIFYPACENELDDGEDVLGESIVEHGLVEFSLFRADLHRNSDELDAYVTVLKEVVEHHVKEEEKELLPKVKRQLKSERLEELGEEMQARFEEALEEDFRGPLRKNLSQVLSGKTKTSKAPARRRRNGASHAHA